MKMDTTRLCAWCGFVAFGFWIVGFFFLFGLQAGFVPAPSPQTPIPELTNMYRQHQIAIRAGLLLFSVGSGLVIPWAVSISMVLKRIEGRYAPLAWCNALLGALLLIFNVIPLFFFQVAAYRAERSDELIYLLSDIGWIMFLGGLFSVIPQGLVIAIAIFKDRSDTPFIPRWVGYLNIWFVVTMCSGLLLYFFKDGPFAWNGVLTFWVAWVGFFAWWLVMPTVVIKATYRIEREAAALGHQIADDDTDTIQRLELLRAEFQLLSDRVQEGEDLRLRSIHPRQ
ncbi:MAG TPA: hypothetical protein VFA63_16715 [Pseudonocardiaceae bacterium]|nr:hypothetical protein [Pseudonocardiaceae bacterium]